MQEVTTIIIIALIACWIGEWSKLVQNIAWWLNAGWFDYIFGCAKCWGFQIGLLYGWLYRFSPEVMVLNNCILNRCVVFAVLCSATAMVMNKIYMRL